MTILVSFAVDKSVLQVTKLFLFLVRFLLKILLVCSV